MLVLNGLAQNLHVLEWEYHIKEKGWGFLLQPFSKYELWNELVKNFHLEAPYLTAIVDNPADIFIANFHPHHKFIAILPCPFLRPSGKSEATIIGRAIAPRFVSLTFKVLILKVIIRIPIAPNTLIGYEVVFVAFI